MEITGGEPDVVGYDKKTGEYTFYDCSAETPKDRGSIFYDGEALEARKENKPKGSAIEMATEMGIELLTEEQYRALQQLGNFDTKSSGWVITPGCYKKILRGHSFVIGATTLSSFITTALNLNMPPEDFVAH